MDNIATTRATSRDTRETYKDNLWLILRPFRVVNMIRDIDLTADHLQKTIIMSCHNNCQTKTTRSPRKAPWWHSKLSGLQAKTRRLLNTAKGQASGIPMKKPSPVRTKISGKPNGLHGGGTARRSLIYQAVADSCRLWRNK
jgi:hypothetical protein